MPNGDAHEPRPTLLQVAREATRKEAEQKRMFKRQRKIIAELQAENAALKAAFRALGLKTPKAKVKK